MDGREFWRGGVEEMARFASSMRFFTRLFFSPDGQLHRACYLDVSATSPSLTLFIAQKTRPDHSLLRISRR